MPRSPASQFPASRLCSTRSSWKVPSLSAIWFASKAYGNRNSTARKPERAACSKRSMKACSVNSMLRLAANLGIGLSLLIQQCDRSGGIARLVCQAVELIDVVDLGAHRNIRHALKNDFDHDRHHILFHPGARHTEG